MPERHQHLAMVTITRRERGVYLCNGSEDQHGTEVWEAFSSLDKAKAWGARYLGRTRLPWRETRHPGFWPMWLAEQAFDGDPIEDDEPEGIG